MGTHLTPSLMVYGYSKCDQIANAFFIVYNFWLTTSDFDSLLLYHVHSCLKYSRCNLFSHSNFRFFVKTLLLLRVQSSDRYQMKDMKILHSMVYLDFWYSSLYLKNKQFCISAISQKKSVKWHVCIYYTDLLNCYLLNIRMNIKNLNGP